MTGMPFSHWPINPNPMTSLAQPCRLLHGKRARPIAALALPMTDQMKKEVW